jgi:prepilin-type N-terminal cleavage/methylation domain-containing protein
MSFSRMSAPAAPQAGFTLVEVLVAFTILLVGMTGIIAMFGTGLKMERQGRDAYESALSIDELRPLVRDELLARVAKGASGEIRIEERELPGRPELRYRVRAVPIPEREARDGWLVEIRVAPPGTPEEDAYSFGWLPWQLRDTYDELVRKSLEDKK